MRIMKMPPRAWIVYLSCLKQPKSLKQISEEWQMNDQATLSNKCEGKPLIDWLLSKKLVNFHSKKGREVYFISDKSFLKGCKLMTTGTNVLEENKLFEAMIDAQQFC